jgi:hypothetical protein
MSIIPKLLALGLAATLSSPIQPRQIGYSIAYRSRPHGKTFQGRRSLRPPSTPEFAPKTGPDGPVSASNPRHNHRVSLKNRNADRANWKSSINIPAGPPATHLRTGAVI